MTRLGWLALTLVACGAPATPPKPTPTVAEAKLHEGPLTDYVAAAGLRWLVVARPNVLTGSRELRPALEIVVPKERMDAFAAGAGLDLTETPEALVAGFDYATLYAARTDDTPRVENAFAERLVTAPKFTSPHSRLRRVTGLIGSTPQTLLTLDPEWMAVSVGSALPARIAEAFALGKLKKSPPALRGAALRSLPESMAAEPLVFYAPGPFDPQWAGGARGLLASATALGVTLTPAPDEQLDVRLYLAGDWPEPDVASRLEAAWGDLAEDPLGRLLALNEPVEAPRVMGTSSLLTLRTRLRARPLAQGLRAAVAAEVAEILDLHEPKTAPNK